MGSPKQHLSMLRSYTAADLFTLANASCGIISIFLCLDYIAEGSNKFFWIGFLLLFLFSVKRGQFDDSVTPPIRMLFDDVPAENKDSKY